MCMHTNKMLQTLSVFLLSFLNIIFELYNIFVFITNKLWHFLVLNTKKNYEHVFIPVNSIM